jgi:signal transduction histidine kinase
MNEKIKTTEIEELHKTNEALRQSLNEFISLREGTKKIFSSREPKDVAKAFCAIAKELLGVDSLEFYIWNGETSEYKELLNENKSRLKPSQEIIDWALKENKSVTVPRDDGSFLTVLPLLVKEHTVGVICIDTTKIADSISQQALELLTTLSSHAAISILNSTLFSTIQNQYNLLSNILDSITNGLITLDNDFGITRINRNAMAMLELSIDIVGSNYHKVLPQGICEIIDMMIHEIQGTGFAMERQFNYKFSSGVELPLAVGLSMLRDEQFLPQGVIIILRDMTATQELERLRRLDQMKSEFVSNVSHDLKTPLTSIKAYTEALQDMIQDGTQKEFLKVVQDESDRLLAMITDLLSVSRIQAGKLKLTLEPTNPKLIVEEILDVSKIQSSRHNIRTYYAGDIPEEILIDKDRMKEAVINLVSNAVKYSPNGGNVDIRMDVFENNLRISVKDEGMGIPKEHIPNLFEQFYRVDSSMTTSIQGTGLGLTIVKGIVEAHNGKITVESEVGKGSTFIILLPIRRQIKRGEMDFDESFA